MKIRESVNLAELRPVWAVLLLLLATVTEMSAQSSRVIRVVDQSIRSGSAGTVVVEMTASGVEGAVGFTINFDPTRLTFVSVAKGGGVSAASLLVNSSQAALGRIGLGLAMPPSDPPQTFSSGTLELVRLTFTGGAVAGDTSVTFSDDVAIRKVGDANAVALSADFQGGKVTVTTIPLAISQSVVTDEDVSKAITLEGSQAGINQLSFAVINSPTKGILSGTAPNLTYTPNANVNGTDSFTFKVNDGSADSDPATVSITINSVNDAPVANAQAITTNEDTPVSVVLAGSDVENSSLAFALVSNPTKGTLSGTPPDLVYTPNANENGSDSFTFKVNDGTVDSAVATISLTIAAVNDVPVANPQSVTTDEDTPKVITLTGSDIEGSTLTFSIVGNPTKGTLSGTPPNIGYVPNANATGQDSFTFKVNDGSLDSPPAAVTITINSLNDAPVAIADTYTVNEDNPLVVAAPGVLANDSDVDVDSVLTAVLVSSPSHGSVDFKADGSFAYVPSTDFNGTDSFTYRVSDGVLDSGPVIVTITVTSVNDPPALAQIGSKSIDEGSTLTFTADGSDLDGTSNVLTFGLAAGAPAGATINANTGVFTWTPAEAQGPGTFPITVEVTDNGTPALKASQTFTVTVNEVNVAPTLPVIGGQTIGEGSGLTVNVQATDVDLPANTLTYNLESGAPAGVAINPTTGVLTWTPTEAQGPGNYSVTVRVTDNGSPVLSATRSIAIAVSEVNSEPALAPVSDQTVVEGDTLFVSASASDSDIPGNSITYSLTGAPAGMTISASGSISWTPTEAQGPGSYSITVQAVDNGSPSLSAVRSFAVNVVEANTPPLLNSIGNQNVDEGKTISFTASASDPDLPSTPLAFSLEPGAPNGASINSATGAFTWTPTEAQGPGSYPITVRVSDGISSATQSFTVTVNEINEGPVMPGIGNQTVDEGSPLLVIAGAADRDEPRNKLTFTVSGAPAGASIDPSSGIFTWTPTEGQGPSTNVITIRVSDGGTPDLSASQTFTVVVNEVNSPPVLAAIPTQNVAEGSALTFSAAATDPDVPANSIIYSLSFDAPLGMSINPTSGVVSWTPTEDQGPGTYNVTIQAADNGFPPQSASRTVTVVVTEGNVAPVLAPISDQTIRAGNVLTFSATATDTDLPPNVLTYSLASGAPAGASINPSTGAFTWTPTAAQGGTTNRITVTVTDNGTPPSNASRTFNVVVTPSNTAPVVTPISPQSVAEGSLLTFPIPAIDVDVPANTLTFALESGAPTGLGLSPAGVVTWTPTEAQGPGTNVITVRISDNGIPPLSTTVNVTIVVQEVNQPPVLAPIGNQTVVAGTALALTATATDADVPANALTFSLGPGAPAGMTINPTTGALTWTPTLAQGGTTNQVTVLVTDNGTPLLTASQIFTVIAGAVNTPPVLTSIGDQTVNEGSSFGFTATATDADRPANILAFSLGPNAPPGMNINPASGLITWTPTETQGPGTFQITVRVTDDGIPTLRATNSFNLTVNEVNVAPVLSAISDQTVNVNSTLTVRTFATDSDRPTNQIAFSLDAGAPAGMAINSSSGVLTWTPTPAQAPSTNRISMRATDNGTPALSDAKSFNVVVLAAPAQPPVLSIIANQTTRENTPTPAIVLTLSDPDTAPANLTLSATSSNPGLVPNENIRFAGEGANRTVTITPALDKIGTVTITVTLEDNTGGRVARSFDLTVTATAPLIVRAPQNVEALAGSDATFGVAASGTKPLNYQWRKNGNAIAGETNSVLVLQNVRAADEGDYSVQVSNSVGSVSSTAAKLSVNDRLRITLQPVSQVVLAGANVTLVVAAGGKGPLGYQWRFNGTAIPGETNPSLVFQNVDATRAGEYSAVVTNATGSVTSDTAKLVVNTPVQFRKQPQSQTVTQGTNVTFTVEALGTPPLAYQWQHDGVNLDGQNNATLTLPQVSPFDSGKYIVVVSNEGGVVSSAAADLTVSVPPVILRQPQSQTALANANVTLSVTVSGSEPLTFVWRFKGAVLPEGTGPTLILPNVGPANEGDYTVVVSNAAGSVTSEVASVKVNQPVVVTEQPKTQTVTAGGPVTFSVVATGTAPITYQWRYNGVNISGATLPSFTIPQVKREDAGRYRVQISNASGPVLSDPAVLTVNNPVTIESQPLSQTVTNGATVVFSVAAAGTAPFGYQWRFNGANIPGATGATLIRTSVQPADAGKYSVVVTNVGGSVTSADAELKIIIPPSIQTQPASRSVQPGTSVTFTVVASGDAPLSYQWQQNGQNISGATSASFTIDNAQVRDAGIYNVVVQNEGGAVTSAKAELIIILPPLNLGNTPEATPPVETAEGTFDGGDLGSPTGLASRKSAQPATANSRWFSWKAPTSGIVTFSTIGSNFDTLLTVYTGTTGNLKEIARDDDRGGFFNSEVTFNATQGETYRINVQGFGGAAGRIVVGFKLNTTTLKLPEITLQPQSQTVPAGSTATFTVQATGASLTYQWYADGTLIAGASNPSLVIQNVQDKDTVKYSVRITSGTLTVESDTALLQIGPVNTRAVDKFRNSPSIDSGTQLAGFHSGPVKDSGGSVARGYSGSQVFNTFGASKEQGEPNHADEIGGASQWFTYQPQTDGVLKVSTEGSNFDTVLAIYTGPGTDFASLKREASDNNSGADGKTSVVILAVKAKTPYYIAVDGVKGATGAVKLSYELGTGPAISLQPQSQNVTLGANVAFFVLTTNVLSGVTTNEPTLKYQWLKDGTKLVGEVNRALTILNVQAASEGEYRVIISNFAGSSTSAVARLSINSPVTITDPPDNKAVKAGESASFSVSASGTDPITYQWRLNGADIRNATDPTLNLNNITILDLGIYTVVVSNPAGSVESSATLSINEGPVITAHPLSVAVSSNQKVAFSVTATGTAPLTYQWQFKGVNITGATNANYELSSAAPGDTGDYTVVVGNVAAVVVSKPATLTVRVPVVLTALPQNRTVTAGSTAVFSVGANGTGPFNYQWKFNEANIAGATNANLTLPNVLPVQAGQYKVAVSSGTNLVESPPAILTVAALPAITLQPVSQTVILGSTASFNVTATGTAPLSFQWFFNDQALPGATNTTLTVTNVQPDLVGTYSVKVSNSAGSVSSSLAALTLGELVSEALLLDGVFQFQLSVPEGKQARVQTSADLQQWNDLGPDTVKPGVSVVRDPGANAFEFRFYRILLE